jgi:hypothetical protein
MMVVVIHPEIIGVEDAGVEWMCPSQGKGAPGGGMGLEMGPKFPSV